MKKQILVLSLLTVLTGIINAQSTFRNPCIPKPGFKNAILSVHLGNSTPSKESVNQSYTVNSLTLGADAFVPLWVSKKGWYGTIKRGSYLGLNVSGTYNLGGRGDLNAPLPTAFNVTGQTASNVVYKGTDPKGTGFRFGLGTQMNFNLGNHFILSPMVLAEYFSISQKTLTATQNTTVNGQNYGFDLWTKPETKTSGFAFKPKIRANFMLTNSIGLFAESSYTLGTKTETQLTKLIPNGNPNQQTNSYNLQQLQTANYIKSEVTKTASNLMNFGVGITIRLNSECTKELTNDNQTPTIGNSQWGPCGCCGEYSSGDHINIHVKNCFILNNKETSWNGTFKGLFEVKNADIIVPKEGGVEKLVATINKAGKVKASVYERKDKKFIKILDKNVNNYYEISNAGDNSMGIIIASGGVFCKVAWCPDGGECKLFSWNGSEKCMCDDGSPSVPNGCGPGGIAVPIGGYLPDAPKLADLTLILDPNENKISSSSVNHIKDLIQSKLPAATLKNVEIIKELNSRWIISTITLGTETFQIVNELKTTKKRGGAVVVSGGLWSIMMYCGNGRCGVSGEIDCRSISPNVLSGIVICDCTRGNCKPQFGKLVGWQEN